MASGTGGVAPSGAEIGVILPRPAPLSPTQRDLYLAEQLNPGALDYRVASSVHLGGSIEPELWQRAVQEVFAAEPLMRSRIEDAGGNISVQFDPTRAIDLRCELDVDVDPTEHDTWVSDWLMSPPPAPAVFRHLLLRTRDGAFYAGIGGPHVLWDGHSHRVFYERVASRYAAIRAGTSPPDKQAPTFYDYMHTVAPVADRPAALAAWRSRLAGIEPLRFATRPAASGEFVLERASLGPATEPFLAWCRAQAIHPASVLIALQALLLDRYRESGGDVLIHGIRGTRPAEFADVVGCFFNVLPYRIPAELFLPTATVADLIAHVADYRRGLGDDHDISMLELQRMLPPGGCRAVFNFWDFERLDLFDEQRTMTAYDALADGEVHLVVGWTAEGMELRGRFHTATFNGSGLADRLRQLLEQLVGGAVLVGDLDPLLDGEHPAIGLAAPMRRSSDVVERFEAHVRSRPDAEALVDGNRRITYGQLNAQANRLARLLMAEGVGPGFLVGLHIGRSAEQVISILAVLKAGGAYVPIDPEYPAARAQLIVADSDVRLLLVDGSHCNVPSGARTLRLDELSDRLDSSDDSDLGRRAQAEDPAYVIYTSGSTGKPKGVMVERHAVNRLFEDLPEPLTFGVDDTWPLLHSYAFDFSVWEIWGALASGGRLVVVPTCIAQAPEDLFDLLDRERVSVLNQTPSAFYRLAETVQAHLGLEALRLVIFGGEALDVSKLGAWFKRFGDERPVLVNMYGITETTVHVTWRQLRHDDAVPAGPSVIGRPLADLRTYLLDGAGRQVPRGVAGELCVAGAGLARGYLGQPDLTAERFRPDPFFLGERMYRSGDLARELPDGQLEYLGRIDEQVQVRGYRVELGEIESVLRTHDGVADAAVVARPDARGDLALFAYVVRISGAEVAESELRDLLRDRLPAYMGCSRYCFPDALPLTTHGKVDRRALPDPGGERPDLAVPYVAPRTQTEEFLAGVLAEVSGVARVGINDNFFDLGGNSLSAVHVVGRIRESLGLSLPIRAVFEAPTVALFAEAIKRGDLTEEADAHPIVVHSNETGDAPLTLAQERVWLIQQLAPEAVAYQFEAGLRFRGDLNVEILELCLQTLVARHEVLRTTFPSVSGRPVQRVHETGTVAFERISLEHLGLDEARAEMERQRRASAGDAFDITELPLIRWKLYRLAPREHVLLHREHHLLHDGWSFVVMVGELLELYRTRIEQRAPVLEDLPVTLSDFARAERVWLEGPGAQRQLEYWREQLEGAPPTLPLPTDHPRPARPTYRGESLRLDLPHEVTSALRAVARDHGVTIFATMLAAFGVLMARIAGVRDICLGSGVANRGRPEVEGLVGMMLNNVVFRLDLGPDPTFDAVMGQAQRTILGALANQDLPFDHMVRLISPSTENGATACPVFFSSYDGPIPHVPVPGLAVDVEAGLPNGSAKFDLNVIVVVEGENAYSPAQGETHHERVSLIWEYNTDLFDRSTAQRMLDRYVECLERAVVDPHAATSAILSPEDAEVDRLLRAAGRTSSYERDETLPQVLAARVAETPHAVAVVDGDTRLTYGVFDSRTNRLARRLQRQGVGRGVRVGIVIDRSSHWVEAIVAVLKAGGAYVPIDPNDPVGRTRGLLDAVEADVVLSTTRHRKLLGGMGSRLVFMDEVDVVSESDAPLENVSEPLDPAYVMFTSGSTGVPKGVEVPHRAVVRLVRGTDYVVLTPDDVVLFLAPPAFDASTFEIWGALLNGARVVVGPPGPVAPAELASLMEREGVTVLWLTAGLFHRLVDDRPDILRALRWLFAGGDVLSPDHVRRALEALPVDAVFGNGYGPTEATTFTCVHLLRPGDEVPSPVPIGRPIANSRVYVLGPDRELARRGDVGELWIGGDGVALGYVGDPELTSERFRPDPFSPVPDGHMYRTGDRVRWRADGTLEFLGRVDRQLKIRGFRIEPGEVEQALRAHPDVKDARVGPYERDGQARSLTAWIVPNGVDLEGAILRAHLLKRLPSHAVPSAWVILDQLPLTVNGKLDIAALPPPARGGDRIGRGSGARARDRLEADLADIWVRTLECDGVGVDDDFFELGGHSLLAVDLFGAIERRFGRRLPLATIFEAPTVRQLAAALREDGWEEPRGALVTVTPPNGSGRPPLFLVAAGDGNSVGFGALARRLGPDQPLFALQQRGINGGALLHRSVEAMARHYEREIRRVQATGPYLLGGRCLGALVAYELARRFEARGDSVPLVAVLDSAGPEWAPRPLVDGRPFDVIMNAAVCDEAPPDMGDVFTPEGGRRLLAWLAEPVVNSSTGRQITRYLMTLYRSRPDLRDAFPDLAGADSVGFLQWAWAPGRVGRELHPGLISRLPSGIQPWQAPEHHWSTRVREYASRAKRRFGELVDLVTREKLTEAPLRRGERARRAGLEAAARYRARRFGGSVTLIRSQEFASNVLLDRWHGVDTGGIIERSVAGSHRSAVREPDVEGLASVLHALIDEALAQDAP